MPGYIAEAGERRPDQRREGVDLDDHAVLDDVRQPRRSGDRSGPVQDHRAARARDADAATGAADANGWFSAGEVVYTKTGAYNGADTFKYAARQAGSQFPLQPAQRVGHDAGRQR